MLERASGGSRVVYSDEGEEEWEGEAEERSGPLFRILEPQSDEVEISNKNITYIHILKYFINLYSYIFIYESIFIHQPK